MCVLVWSYTYIFCANMCVLVWSYTYIFCAYMCVLVWSYTYIFCVYVCSCVNGWIVSLSFYELSHSFINSKERLQHVDRFPQK